MQSPLKLFFRIALVTTFAPILSSWAWTTTTTAIRTGNNQCLGFHLQSSLPLRRMMTASLTLRSISYNHNSRCDTLLMLSERSDNNNADSDSKNDSQHSTSSTTSSSSSSASSSTENPLVESTIASSWVSSFDESGRSLVEEENNERISQMGEFDTNPAYQPDRMEQMRAAIKARTESLGMEKSKVSQQLIQEASARAAAGQRNNVYGLDLSKITSANTPGNNVREEMPEGMPTMFFDPEEQMTEEEKLEADPDSQLSFWDQGLKEFQNAKWPTFWSALREVGVMIVVVIFSAVLIIGWDRFLRDVYTSWGFIPRPEDALSGRSLDGLELPQGWTNNMNDQDVARLENEMTRLNLMPTPTIPSSPPPSTGSLPGL